MFEISPRAQEHWYLLPNITWSVIVLHQYLRRLLYNIFLFPLPYYFKVLKKKFKVFFSRTSRASSINRTFQREIEIEVVLIHWEHNLWHWSSGFGKVKQGGGHKMTPRQKQQNPLWLSPLIHTSCMERPSNFFYSDTDMFFTQSILQAYEPHSSNPSRVLSWQVEQHSTIQITQIYNLQKCKRQKRGTRVSHILPATMKKE